MIQLENHHIATCNEITDLENYHQWMLKLSGERLIGYFLMKGPDWSLKIIKRGIDRFNIIISRTLEEIFMGVGYCGDGFQRCVHRSKFIILGILITCTLLYANYTSKSYFLKSRLKHYVSHDGVGSTQCINKLILTWKTEPEDDQTSRTNYQFMENVRHRGTHYMTPRINNPSPSSVSFSGSFSLPESPTAPKKCPSSLF